MKKKIDLIFDLDGCLIDSTEVQKAAFYGSYAEVVGDDKCPAYEEYIKYTGDSITNVMIKMGLPVEMVEPYRRISSEAVDKIIVNTEAIDMIRRFRDEGCKVAICTGKDHYRAEEILRFYNIENYFDVLVSSDDVSEPKPSAIPIIACIEALGVDKESVIVIGDGYNDIMSAKNAGVRSVLTLWYGDEGVPREADYLVESVAELYELLASLL